jgi:hypothetical protein
MMTYVFLWEYVAKYFLEWKKILGNIEKKFMPNTSPPPHQELVQ